MQTTITAAFQSRVGARDAISELTHFGLHAADISIADTDIGVGTMFGTAQTMTPGCGSTDISTMLQPCYPLSARGGMPGGIVAETPDDVLVSLMDFGLSEETAGEAASALSAGAVLLAVTVEETAAKPVQQVLERCQGELITA